MNRRLRVISIGLLVLFSCILVGCTAKRKSTLEIPEGFTGIVGCGTLISQQSLEKTLGHKYEGPSYEVHVKGYERVWRRGRPLRTRPYILRGTERVPILGFAALDLSPKKKGWINGVLYLLTDEELQRLDEWERDYRRVDVTDEIEEFRFRGGKVYVYVGLPSSTPSSSADKGIYIQRKEFLDLVTNACDSRGTDFREEFDRTTRPCEYEIVSIENILYHPDVGIFLNNLGKQYYEQGKYIESEDFYKQALAIFEKALGPNHPQVATVLENMTELYKKMGNEEEAKKFEERARKIRSKK